MQEPSSSGCRQASTLELDPCIDFANLLVNGVIDPDRHAEPLKKPDFVSWIHSQGEYLPGCSRRFGPEGDFQVVFVAKERRGKKSCLDPGKSITARSGEVE